jgi:hypothetical protein
MLWNRSEEEWLFLFYIWGNWGPERQGRNKEKIQDKQPNCQCFWGPALCSFCSHSPESCSWLKFCPHWLRNTKSQYTRAHMLTHNHWSRKCGNKQELNQIGERSSPNAISPHFCYSTKTVKRINLCTRSKWNLSERVGKKAIFSLQSHSLSCVSWGLSQSPMHSTVLFLKEKYHLNAM